MNYINRIKKLEAALLPEHELRVCVLFNVAEEDEDAAIASWRDNHAWPNDGRHPIQLLRIRWANPVEDAPLESGSRG